MKCAIGQDSHAFTQKLGKPLILGGVSIMNGQPLKGNSDADVVLHALTNAISGITGVNILGSIADEMCIKHNITDSSMYVKEALKYMFNYKITHVSFSVECLVPKLANYIDNIRKNIADLLAIDIGSVGFTAHSGEELTLFGRGKGIMCTCIITVESKGLGQ
ncbi:MAG TPA: 2-C-methyl-D-erythritol 2,4-cyclodiphosphate synthase [Clostridia bacterium]|nr:2-C-methyl-D-erythritol 2,4-cyclodiphosphate synthase [Clostridia bacterium]